MLKSMAEDIKGLTVQSGSLNESFSEKNLEKVSNLIASVFSKGSDGKYHPFKMEGWYKQEFKTVNGEKGVGYGFISDKGFMLRLGYVSRKVKGLSKKFKETYSINTVSYWKPDGTAKFDKPSITIDLKPWMNVVDSVQVIKDVFDGKITESEINENEKTNAPKKLIAYAHAKGYEQVDGTYWHYSIKKLMGDDFDPQEYKGYVVTDGGTENNSMENSIQENEQRLEKQKYADPKVIFDDIESLTKVVGMGLQNSLVIVGDAGIGKCLAAETEIPVFGI